MSKTIENPFRPGAGHKPPYLAGRTKETNEFKRLLQQDVILTNFLLTGLRGVGKTVLVETFKPVAVSAGWLWVGTDLSEASSLTEERMALRLLTDLSVVTAGMQVGEQVLHAIGFESATKRVPVSLDFKTLERIYAAVPGLPSDKLKATLETVWRVMQARGDLGIIFAYDEAQNLSDHAQHNEFPTSLLLDVFQSIQRKEIRFMLMLAGLPTLFPKLVEARTFSERMFRVVFLERLPEDDSRDAIVKPIEDAGSPITLQDRSVRIIIELSGGYPYFIQFICREVFDAFIQGQDAVPVNEITLKLDSDFFSGRWSRATDRQRELLRVIATLKNSDSEFSVQEIAERSAGDLEKPFSASHINQMLAALSNAGLIYKNRHGKYSFAVPLLGRFILRQSA